MSHVDADLEAATAALMALTEANIPPDVQELLVYGNDIDVAPGALSKAVKAALLVYQRLLKLR
jgi:hypothetical protein